ncbi:MAG: hypothetical protein ACRCSS_11860, partial [Shewanella sp.]
SIAQSKCTILKQDVVKKGAARLNGANNYRSKLYLDLPNFRLRPVLAVRESHHSLAATLCINSFFHLELLFTPLSLSAHKTKTIPNSNIPSPYPTHPIKVCRRADGAQSIRKFR